MPSQFQDAEAIGLGDPAWPLPNQGAPTPTYHACSRAALTPNRDDSTLLVGRKVTRYLPNASENQLTSQSLLHSTRAAPGTGWKTLSREKLNVGTGRWRHSAQDAVLDAVPYLEPWEAS